MRLRNLISRILLGLAGIGGLASSIIGAVDGKLYWRGDVTTLADKPGLFWFLTVMNSALFAGLLVWAVSGRGFGNARRDEDS
jgi:hypothetical protein